MTTSNDFVIDKITVVKIEIYGNVVIPDDLTKSTHKHYLKKAVSKKWELDRIINLTSHITKLMVRILMKKVGRRFRPEIEQGVCQGHLNKKCNINDQNGRKRSADV